MARKTVRFIYEFEFEPGETGWHRISDVEKSLAQNWLAPMGFVGEKVEMWGQPEHFLVKITKKEEIQPIVMKDTATPVKEQLARATAKAKGQNVRRS